MRILLINPPRRHELVGKNPSIIEKHRGFNPPLGLLYLAAMAKRSSSHAVDVIDTQPLRWDYETLKKHLQGAAYDLVGVTGLTFTLVDVFKTIQVIKEASPGTKVLVGGTHVHLFPEETINLPGVDYAFMGEARAFFDGIRRCLCRPRILCEHSGACL